MDKAVPFWIPIVNKSHILSAWLPPWNDWRATFDSPKMKKTSITSSLTAFSLYFTVQHFDFWAVEKKPSFHTISSFFCKPCWTHDLLCSPLPQHYLKQPSGHARPLPDHCPWTFIFYLFFLPFPMAFYYLFHYFAPAHVYCYFIPFCWCVHKTTFTDISLDSPFCWPELNIIVVSVPHCM